jgi:glycosyltransferase involved in cell wall biosynthesis
MASEKQPAQPRILVAGHLPPPAGGVATYYQSLLNSSLPEKVDLKFVQTSTHNRKLDQSGKFSLSNVFAAIADCWRFMKAVNQHKPQVSHIATAFGLSFVKHSICVVIARLFGSRVLLHPHCGFGALYTDRPGWWKWYFRQVIRLTQGVITLSSEWDLIKEVVPGCPVYFLPNAINLDTYRGIFQQHKMRSRNISQIKVLYLGYLGRDKGTFDLIEAAQESMRRKTAVIFDLFGDDLEAGEVKLLKEAVLQKGLEGVVHFHPFADAATKLDAFSEADVFIYPSYSEGMPMAVIEAMACGLPIVATRVGGLPDLVHEGENGILVDPRCPDQLADALQRLSSHPDIRTAMERTSFKTAYEQYDMEILVPKLVAIYQKALA